MQSETIADRARNAARESFGIVKAIHHRLHDPVPSSRYYGDKHGDTAHAAECAGHGLNAVYEIPEDRHKADIIIGIIAVIALTASALVWSMRIG